MNEFVEKLVLRAHQILFEDSYSPAVSSVISKLKDLIDRECLATIYADVDFSVNEEDVHALLSKYRCCHRYFGTVYFDAQIILFEGWLDHIRLLKGD